MYYFDGWSQVKCIHAPDVVLWWGPQMKCVHVPDPVLWWVTSREKHPRPGSSTLMRTINEIHPLHWSGTLMGDHSLEASTSLIWLQLLTFSYFMSDIFWNLFTLSVNVVLWINHRLQNAVLLHIFSVWTSHLSKLKHTGKYHITFTHLHIHMTGSHR